MDNEHLISFANELLWGVLAMSLPVIFVTAMVGLLISIIQALTQIQEQTVLFLIKLIAACITFVITQGWMGRYIYNYAVRVFEAISIMR